jgi:FkbM family methyltransferase
VNRIFLIRERIKKFFFVHGYKLSKIYNPLPDYSSIDIVLDVGANVGQFALRTRYLGFEGDIYSFEPLSKEHAQLSKNSQCDPRWFVAERCALGSSIKTSSINVSKNSYSSSLLEILPVHVESAPNSFQKDIEPIKIITLDSFLKGINIDNKNILLKIDTQGYEYHVLKGAKEFLSKIYGIQIELSTISLYKGQDSFLEILSFLEEYGFQVWDVKEGFRQIESGRLLQFDAILFNSNLKN